MTYGSPSKLPSHVTSLKVSLAEKEKALKDAKNSFTNSKTIWEMINSQALETEDTLEKEKINYCVDNNIHHGYEAFQNIVNQREALCLTFRFLSS